MTPPVLAWRAASLAHLALILAVALREWSVLGVLLAAMLCIPLPGILRGRSYTCAWASMLVGIYVAGYLAAGYARPAAKLEAFALATLALLDYLSLMMYVRWRGREALAARTEPSGGAAH